MVAANHTPLQSLLIQIFRIKFFFRFFWSYAADFYNAKDLKRMRSLLSLAINDEEVKNILYYVQRVLETPHLEKPTEWFNLLIETLSYFEEPKRSFEVEEIISNLLDFGKTDDAERMAKFVCRQISEAEYSRLLSHALKNGDLENAKTVVGKLGRTLTNEEIAVISIAQASKGNIQEFKRILSLLPEDLHKDVTEKALKRSIFEGCSTKYAKEFVKLLDRKITTRERVKLRANARAFYQLITS